MNPDAKIHIAGHRGLVGSALMRRLTSPSPLAGEGRGEGAKPTEVETLLGDPTKAKEKLGWTPRTTFDELIKKHGYKAMDYHE